MNSSFWDVVTENIVTTNVVTTYMFHELVRFHPVIGHEGP